MSAQAAFARCPSISAKAYPVVVSLSFGLEYEIELYFHCACFVRRLILPFLYRASQSIHKNGVSAEILDLLYCSVRRNSCLHSCCAAQAESPGEFRIFGRLSTL